MSDPSRRLNPVENGSDQQHLLNPAEQDKQINKNNVCRDFLKHVCRRGKRCKFLHPDELEQTEEPFNFCIDFQNRGCVRQNCRFIHAAEELVSEYMTTREVTLPLAQCIVAVSTGNTIAGIPLCGEFQDGICTRTGCRYWHINADEERTRRATQPVARVSDHTVNGYGVGVKRPIDLLENPPYAKMSRLNDYGMTAHPSHVMDFERSNAELRKEVDMLRFQLRNERERYQDLYSLFRQLVGFGTVRLQAPQPPHPGQLPQTAVAATPSQSFPPVGGYKPPSPAPEWQGQTPSKW